MNIFFLSADPEECARLHVDKHVVKMIIEYLQLLCSAIWMVNPERNPPYRLTHKNHPCSIWVRQCKLNWLWLQALALELCAEYTYRYGKTHSAQEIIETLDVPDLPDLGFSCPPQCMDDKYKNQDPIEAYRAFYRYGKAHIHSWSGKVDGSCGSRPVPDWITSQ